MAIDHTEKIFFPDSMIMAIIGRIAFPLFAYCVVVGCLYTHDMKKYLLRLAIFGVVSQPFYVLAFHPTKDAFFQEILSLNILFTLIAGIMAINALMNIKRNWWMLIVAIAMEIFLGLDYGFYGILLMVIFYICRNKTWLSALLVSFWMILHGYSGNFIEIGSIGLGLQIFSMLALPFIYFHTNTKLKVNKYVFYIFYPLHLLIIFIVRIILQV